MVLKLFFICEASKSKLVFQLYKKERKYLYEKSKLRLLASHSCLSDSTEPYYVRSGGYV